jgi:coenzyme PQQ precursor peptide PqqA
VIVSPSAQPSGVTGQRSTESLGGGDRSHLARFCQPGDRLPASFTSLRLKDDWPIDRSAARFGQLHQPWHGAGVLQRSQTMRWSKPKIIELAVGLEINSYACAEIV